VRLVAEAAVAKLSLHTEDTCSFHHYCRMRVLSGEMSSFSVNHAPRQPASLEPPDRDPTRNLDAALQSFTGIPSSFMWVMAPLK
jgi:hypothetical protein